MLRLMGETSAEWICSSSSRDRGFLSLTLIMNVQQFQQVLVVNALFTPHLQEPDKKAISSSLLGVPRPTAHISVKPARNHLLFQRLQILELLQRTNLLGDYHPHLLVVLEFLQPFFPLKMFAVGLRHAHLAQIGVSSYKLLSELLVLVVDGLQGLLEVGQAVVGVVAGDGRNTRQRLVPPIINLDNLLEDEVIFLLYGFLLVLAGIARGLIMIRVEGIDNLNAAIIECLSGARSMSQNRSNLLTMVLVVPTMRKGVLVLGDEIDEVVIVHGRLLGQFYYETGGSSNRLTIRVSDNGIWVVFNFIQYSHTYPCKSLLYNMFKALLIAALVLGAFAWTEEGNVLVLTDDDFPAVYQEFSHILIEFYAPWCGHCKKLAPVYKEVADALKEQGSVLRVAKVDATENSKEAGKLKVQGYPTLFFFLNGEKIDYTGQRNKEGMLNWLTKKTRDPVTQIDADKYAALASEGGVSVVYHGDFTSAEGAQTFNVLALADDYNTYYWGTDLGQEAGTIEIIRNFDASATYKAIDDGLKAWISNNQRPLIVDFDERTIGDMFGSAKKGLVLFNGKDDSALLDAFTEAAKEYSSTDGESFIFTEINSKSEHLENFANYIKINHKANPVILVDAKGQTKYVLTSEPTKENIVSFLGNYNDFKYGLTDEVKADTQEEATEGEL